MHPYEFGGTHVICDVSGIHPDVVGDTDLISGAIVRGIRASGATLCGMQVKEFQPSGMTAVYLLSESHVSVHTYPDSNSLFLDAFTCGERCSPQTVVDELLLALGSCEHRTSVVRRGLATVRAAHPQRHEPSISGAVRGTVVPLPQDVQLSATAANA
jgi:S-adenosylmethionine decarboxylase